MCTSSYVLPLDVKRSCFTCQTRWTCHLKTADPWIHLPCHFFWNDLFWYLSAIFYVCVSKINFHISVLLKKLPYYLSPLWNSQKFATSHRATLLALIDLSMVKKEYFCYGLGLWVGMVRGFSLILGNHNIEVNCSIFLSLEATQSMKNWRSYHSRKFEHWTVQWFLSGESPLEPLPCPPLRPLSIRRSGRFYICWSIQDFVCLSIWDFVCWSVCGTVLDICLLCWHVLCDQGWDHCRYLQTCYCVVTD
jgi:hypothetical protein